MKLPKLKLKVKLPLFAQVSIGILGAVAVMGIAFFILQRYLSVFSYLGLNPSDVDKVKENIENECTLISTAVRDGRNGMKRYRGVYMCNGIPLYYHYDRGSNSAAYSIYPILWEERWASSRDWSGLTGTTHVP